MEFHISTSLPKFWRINGKNVLKLIWLQTHFTSLNLLPDCSWYFAVARKRKHTSQFPRRLDRKKNRIRCDLQNISTLRCLDTSTKAQQHVPTDVCNVCVLTCRILADVFNYHCMPVCVSVSHFSLYWCVRLYVWPVAINNKMLRNYSEICNLIC